MGVMKRKAEDTGRILVALDLTHQSGRDQLSGFYRFADRKNNWEMRLVPSTEPTYLPMVRRFLEEGVAGAIIKGECVQPLADAIRKAGVPVVAIDRPHSEKEDVADMYVCNDNTLIGRSAAQFFDTLGRFASYGFVPDPNGCEWSRARGKAFRGACAAKHRHATVSTARGDLAGWLADLPKPAAVFAAFDQCAADVLEACRTAKLKVPKDLAVLGAHLRAYAPDAVERQARRRRTGFRRREGAEPGDPRARRTEKPPPHDRLPASAHRRTRLDRHRPAVRTARQEHHRLSRRARAGAHPRVRRRGARRRLVKAREPALLAGARPFHTGGDRRAAPREGEAAAFDNRMVHEAHRREMRLQVADRPCAPLQFALRQVDAAVARRLCNATRWLKQGRAGA